VPKSYYDVRSEYLVNCLPELIEHVTVNRCYASSHVSHPFLAKDPSKYVAERTLMAFASAAAARLTNLKKVTYCCGNDVVEKEWMTKLSDKFSAIGIQFVWITAIQDYYVQRQSQSQFNYAFEIEQFTTCYTIERPLTVALTGGCQNC